VTWEHVLSISDQVGAVDLAIDPHNPRRMFATAWRAERKPWTIISGSEDSGLFFSSDRGDTWRKVGNGLPEGLVGKMAVEISPADPQRVYVLAEAPGTARGLYRSDDGGANFRQVNGQLSLTFRPFYYTHMTADPADPDRVWVNNETLWLSKDGGKTFESVATPHGDNHALWIHPQNSRVMVQGNDGGANVSRDGGVTWSPQWNQPTAELYQVATDSAFPYRVYGAQQDNTTISVPSRISRQPLDPKQDWLEVSGCETGPVVAHPQDPGTVYGGCKGRHSVFDQATGQVRQYWVYPHFNYGHDTREMPFRFQRVAPMILSPHDPQILYHGSQVVHRSRDEGRSWEAISPDLTAFEDETQGYSGGPITRDITGEEVYSALYAIAESPLEQGVLWAGSNDGPIHVSRNGGESWTEVTPPDLPKGGRVNRIEPSPHRAGRVWVAVYRYLLDDFRPYLYRSDDYGASWTLLTTGSNGIPADEPVRVVREDPQREELLYVGTESGLYVTFDGGTRFQPLQLDLPVVPISGLEVRGDDLVVATMGRSFWILDDLSPVRAAVAGSKLTTRLLAPRPAPRTPWVGDLSSRFPGYAPEYPIAGAVIDYVLAHPATRVELRIEDSTGEVVRTLVESASERRQAREEGRAMPKPVLGTGTGHQRVIWDLRAEGLESLSLEADARQSPGPLLPPGIYRLQLDIDGVVFEESLELLLDPRVAASGITVEDVQAQYRLVAEVLRGYGRLRDAVHSMRVVGTDLELLGEREDLAAHPELQSQVATLLQRAQSAETVLRQRVEGKVGAELEPQLSGQFGYLLGMLTAADQRPGQDAYDRWSDLQMELAAALVEVDALWADIGRVEELLEGAGMARFRRQDD
jgi:photosystem II stability/assembly factor-like uncharacterized protein